jgi:hypothetical protein
MSTPIWDDLLISSKSSKIVKDTLNHINTSNNLNDEKYIGVIPIYWDSLGIMRKNEETRNYDRLILDKINLSLNDDIQNIYTTKSKILIDRGFFYQTKIEKKTKKMVKSYPVYKFPNNISFTMREIGNKITEWLTIDGFCCDDIELFRIYKMAGYHIFVVLMPNKPSIKNLKNDWTSMISLELLSFVDKEIVNSIMKISQVKFNYKINNYPISSDWDTPMNGYLSEYNEIIPFELKWDEIIATLANLIDSDAENNLHLYFVPNIIDEHNNNLFLSKSKKQKTKEHENYEDTDDN